MVPGSVDSALFERSPMYRGKGLLTDVNAESNCDKKNENFLEYAK